MKKYTLIIALALSMFACKNTSEEVRTGSDGDTKKDTISVVSNEDISGDSSSEITQPEEPAAAEKIPTNKPAEKVIVQSDYAAFGQKFSPNNILTPAQMLSKYKNLKSGDTIAVKFKSSIKEVCKKKGCWMSMALPSEQESFIRFRDYGFFVPLNADGSEAIVNGRAYVDVITVAEQQHYAKDGGKSQQEIDQITEPKVTYVFQADGVLIK